MREIRGGGVLVFLLTQLSYSSTLVTDRYSSSAYIRIWHS
jgi:hypothetical protein